MRSSNIGGQAVMEGIMMRHKDKYSIAVRRPDQEIELKVEDYKCIFGNHAFLKKPIIRGVVSLSLIHIWFHCSAWSRFFRAAAKIWMQAAEESDRNKRARIISIRKRLVPELCLDSCMMPPCCQCDEAGIPSGLPWYFPGKSGKNHFPFPKTGNRKAVR